MVRSSYRLLLHWKETDYLLALAESTESIVGVVGWVDLNDEDYVSHTERFLKHAKCVGFRVMIQEVSDANAILEPHYVEALRWFAKKEVPIDLLVVSHQLEPLIQLLDQVPGLRGVIDHIAKPRIADQIREPWAAQMKELAKHENLYCKLSGMVTEVIMPNGSLMTLPFTFNMCLSCSDLTELCSAVIGRYVC